MALPLRLHRVEGFAWILRYPCFHPVSVSASFMSIAPCHIIRLVSSLCFVFCPRPSGVGSTYFFIAIGSLVHAQVDTARIHLHLRIHTDIVMVEVHDQVAFCIYKQLQSLSLLLGVPGRAYLDKVARAHHLVRLGLSLPIWWSWQGCASP
jgi:hypothetical protein